MGRWTAEQANFLRSEGFENPRQWALNATGMTMREIREALRTNDKLFAYGYKECRDGHTLRTAAGCPQCNTQYLTKLKESIKQGVVYLAWSPSEKLIKIGCSADVDDRLYMLRLQGYGGINDWELKYIFYVKRMGKAESAVKRIIVNYKIRITWMRQGHLSTTDEIYNCSMKVARDAILRGTEYYRD